jgi:NTE family protein
MLRSVSVSKTGSTCMSKCLWIMVGFVLPLAALGQCSRDPSPRKKVALVLEGGSAFGLAHVGVLEWLDENHIPVDCIAGTSMGAMLGGMYAMGYSPAEIHKTVATTDWDAVLYDRIDYQDLAFSRKQDARTYPNTLAFGFREGFRLPESFNAGHRVGLILDDITQPYWKLQSFDDLPIPFRCVATDLAAVPNRADRLLNNPHVFRDGSLSFALRSTMALPGFFSPVHDRENKTVYIDGGVLENLPVEVARKMGADIVIAVHLRTRPFDPTKPISFIDVLGNTILVITSTNEVKSLFTLTESDVEINVDVSRFVSADYDKYKELMQQGRKAIEQDSVGKKILALRLDDAAWDELAQRRLARKPPAFSQDKVQDVAVDTEDSGMAEAISQGLSKYKGRPFDAAQARRLQTDLNRLVGTGRFARLGYRMVERDSQKVLEISATRRDYSFAVIKPVIAIDGSDYQNPLFVLGARLTAFDVGGPGSEWRSQLLLGSRYGLSSEYDWPIRPFSRFFFAPQATADSSPLNIYRDQDLLARNQLRKLSGALDLGFDISRNAQIRVGYEGGGLKLSHILGNAALLPFSSGHFGTTSFKFAFDRLRFGLRKLEAPVVPRDGAEFDASFQWHDSWLGASDHFATAESDAAAFKSVNAAGSLYVKGSGGSTLGFTNNGLPSFSLGGPLRLAAYGSNEFLTNQYFYGSAGYVHKVYKLPSLLGGNIYLTAAYEIGKPYGIPGAPSLPMDGVAGVLLDYAFGPLFLGGAGGESGHRKFFFYLGRWF